MIKNNPKISLCFSTTADGNMSFLRGDYNQSFKNRTEFFQKNNLSFQNSVWMRTPHQSNVHITTIHDKTKGATNTQTAIEVDSFITNQKGILLSLVVADCIPLTLYDQKTNTLALLHLSRKNINTLIEESVSVLKQNFLVHPKNIESLIGPSIGPCCYTWHPNQSPETDAEFSGFIIESKANKTTLDLWGVAEKRLLEQGISRKNITNLNICTYHNPNYFSHREYDEKNLPQDARFAVCIGLK